MIARIGHVEIIGVCRELSCKCINLFDTWYNPEGLSESPHLSLSLLKWKKVRVLGNLLTKDKYVRACLRAKQPNESQTYLTITETSNL